MATRLASRFFEWFGFKKGDAQSLQMLPADDLFRQFGKFIDQLDDPLLVGGRAGRWLLSPVIDGIFLPADPFSPASPESRDVPLIIGTNKNEAALILASIPNINTIDDSQVIRQIRKVLGDRAEEVFNAHRKNRPEESSYDLLTAISSEDRRILSIELAEEKSKQDGAPVYMYFFTWESNKGLLRAAHTIEVPFIFRNIEASRIIGTREDRYALADIMSNTWISFARNGDPNNSMLPKWESYDSERRATMILDVPPKLEFDPWREERLAWKGTSVKLPWEGVVFVTAMPGK